MATAWIILDDLQQGRGPRTATAAQLLDEITVDTAQLEAVRAWRDGGQDSPKPRPRLATLSSFLHDDPADYLDSGSDLEELAGWTTCK